MSFSFTLCGFLFMDLLFMGQTVLAINRYDKIMAIDDAGKKYILLHKIRDEKVKKVYLCMNIIMNKTNFLLQFQGISFNPAQNISCHQNH